MIDPTDCGASARDQWGLLYRTLLGTPLNSLE